MHKRQYLISLLSGGLLFLFFSCTDSRFDQLMKETQDFLIQQEKARCTCLDQHGKVFSKNLKEGIRYLEQLPQKYSLDSLKLSEYHAIKLGIVEATSILKILTNCVQSKIQPPDQLTAMLIQEDLKVILAIDSSLSEQQKFELMNQPGREIMQKICPQHLDKMDQFNTFIQRSTILPKGLQ